MSPILKCAIFVIIFVFTTESANILMISSLVSPSYHRWNLELINELAMRGHNLTILTPDNDESPPLNVTYFSLNKIYQHEKYLEHESAIIDQSERDPDAFDSYFSLCEGD